MDQWTVRENLILATVVKFTETENWPEVSRALLTESITPRPPGWYSEKKCLEQLNYLIANAEKVQTQSEFSQVKPLDFIIRRLKEDREKELVVEMQQQREAFAQLYLDNKAFESGTLNKEQIRTIYSKMLKEKEAICLRQKQLENQRRECENMSHNRGTGGISLTHENLTLKSNEKSSENTIKLMETVVTQQTGVQTVTAPLLSSLLKSPNATILASASNSLSGVNRVNAPTIKTLLTSGSIPNAHQPALKLRSNVPADEAAQLLTRPISGPPVDSTSANAVPLQTSPSPSQSAPTLSMLLEKNKNVDFSSSSVEPRVKETEQIQRETIVTKFDSNTKTVDMDIDNTLNKNSTTLVPTDNVDIDETDPNEEQQLMEVFQNIGNIDELDIDVDSVINEDVDFLKDVDEEQSQNDEKVESDDKQSFEASSIKLTTTKQIDDTKEEGDIKDENNGISPINKVELISSDDSNDNLPLAAVASLENKDRSNSSRTDFTTDSLNNATTKNEEETQNIKNPTSAYTETMEPDNKLKDKSENKNENENLKSENSDVVIIPSDDDEETDHNVQNKDKSDSQHYLPKKEASITNVAGSFPKTSEANDEVASKLTTTTDNTSEAIYTVVLETDDSGTTDTHTDIQIEEPNQSKSENESNLVDKSDDTVQSTSHPNLSKTSMSRKTRENEHSKSPVIDDDTNTTISEHSITNQRFLLRGSSTPASPNSIQSDEPDMKTDKKMLLTLCNTLQANKQSLIFQKVFSGNSSARVAQQEVCLRPIDFEVIKKNIETHAIRNVAELYRDLLLMSQNALMLLNVKSNDYKTVLTFIDACKATKEFSVYSDFNMVEAGKDTKEVKASQIGGNVKFRSGSRKSLRNS